MRVQGRGGKPALEHMREQAQEHMWVQGQEQGDRRVLEHMLVQVHGKLEAGSTGLESRLEEAQGSTVS